ncbi:unnamed protein product [Closterium sp. NIES-53]
MASPTLLTFDTEGRAVAFDVWLDDLQLFLQCDSRDGLSLFDLTSGASSAPAADADSTVRSQWLTRDAAARLARAHFSQYKSAKTLYDAVVARYSSPATAALSRLMLPYLFLDLAAFATVTDLITHLHTSDTRYRAALPAEDHFLSLCPTTLTVDLLKKRLLAAETSITAVGASRGDQRTPFFEGCSPVPLLPSVASAAAVNLVGTESVSAASAPSERRHLATFTRRPGSSLYTLTREPPLVAASGQVAASSQVFAAASRSGPESAPCSCRLLSHQTLLWHHRIGHPSLPRLRGMASRVLVSGLPWSLPPLPPGPAPTCVPCVEGRQRAVPHSSEFPPTEAPLQTLHMDVWGPARVRGQGHERYFSLVVDDYSHYTTVFPLRSKGEVPEVLIDWIRAARLQLRERFGSDFPVLRLHSDRDGEFSSDLLRAFCRAEGIRQTFTLPASPQQNGIAECRIVMVMDVARTSMIHAASPHFLWPFAVHYAAHQINLQPRVSLPETSPTMRWTGQVGDASAFRAWGSRAFVRDLSADKLSSRAVPCDVTFDESVPYYHAIEPVEVATDSGASRGAEPRCAESRGAAPGSAESGGAGPGASVRANIVSGMWIFRVKRPPGSPPVFKARYVARGFSQRQGVDYFQTYSPTPKMTTLRAPREWHDTLRTTLAALGFAPSTADPSLFLRTDTLVPPFYILVYVDDLVFATADTAGLTYVKSELQKRHTCTDLGELRSYLGLQITRDRARGTITLSQSHMVQQVLQRFDFTYSSPQATPLSTRHSLSALPLDESVEPSGPYPELVGCLMYLMTCTRPDLAYPLSILARYVAPGRHQPDHMAAAKRVLRYLCSTSGLGLVLGGQSSVVLSGHADTSWVDDLATQRSSQGYTFSLGSGSVSWRSTRLSSVLSSSCEAEIYAGAMAAQELRWLTYLLTDLGEPPRSPPVLYVENKAMLALCREHRLEHRMKHIALRYFLACELQQRGQLRLAYVASQANTADIFTKALQPCDHQRFCTMLACFALLCLTGLENKKGEEVAAAAASMVVAAAAAATPAI